MSTYEDTLAELRVEWMHRPGRRAEIKARADEVIRQRHLAPLIAVHEAGHAVIAYALGYQVACLSRVGNSDCGIGGHVHIADQDRLKQWPGDNALIAAGGAALAVIADLPDHDPYRGCERDRQLVDQLEHDWHGAVADARLVLLDGWEPVAKRLAHVLMLHPWLDADEFEAVVTGRPRGKVLALLSPELRAKLGAPA